MPIRRPHEAPQRARDQHVLARQRARARGARRARRCRPRARARRARRAASGCAAPPPPAPARRRGTSAPAGTSAARARPAAARGSCSAPGTASAPRGPRGVALRRCGLALGGRQQDQQISRSGPRCRPATSACGRSLPCRRAGRCARRRSRAGPGSGSPGRARGGSRRSRRARRRTPGPRCPARPPATITLRQASWASATASRKYGAISRFTRSGCSS